MDKLTKHCDVFGVAKGAERYRVTVERWQVVVPDEPDVGVQAVQQEWCILGCWEADLGNRGLARLTRRIAGGVVSANKAKALPHTIVMPNPAAEAPVEVEG